MVDWDELFEDVNWTALISLMVLGLILIGLSVFIGMDWSRANSIKIKLENNLAGVEEFNRKLAVPPNWKADLQGQIIELNQELRALGGKLPSEFSQPAMRQRIADLASENGVIMVSLPVFRVLSETAYIKRHTGEVVFRSSDIKRVASFYQSLINLPEPHTASTPRLAPNIDVTLTITFYSFDQDDFEKAYPCRIDVVEPAPTEVDLTKVRFFKDKLESLEYKLQQEHSGLDNTKTTYLEYCRLKNQAEALRHELDFSKAKWGK